MRSIFYTSLFVLFSVSIISAQGDVCPAEVNVILSTVADTCDGLARNQVCFGNSIIESETIENGDSFTQVGDIIDVNQLLSLQTYGLSTDFDEWGIAIFKLRANLPDTLSGQNVTMIVFGDTEISSDNDAPEEYSQIMQSFYLSTGVGIPACNSIPNAGVLIQNPRGTQVNLRVNGIELQIGSTALFTAEDTEELTILTLDGNVQVTIDDMTQDIPAGFTLTVDTDVDSSASDLTSIPEIEILPAELLPEPIPQIGVPNSEAIGLLRCANTGGVDVSVGDTLFLRGGWGDASLEDVVNFATSTSPTLEFDDEAISFSYRSQPVEWTLETGEGFAIHWYWEVADITQGTHQAVWGIGDETFVCEIRAN